jgi:hypothetical protein
LEGVASVVDHLKVTDDPLTACDAIRVYDEVYDNAIYTFAHHVGGRVRVLYRAQRSREPGWTRACQCCVTTKREAEPERGSEDRERDRQRRYTATRPSEAELAFLRGPQHIRYREKPEPVLGL